MPIERWQTKGAAGQRREEAVEIVISEVQPPVRIKSQCWLCASSNQRPLIPPLTSDQSREQTSRWAALSNLHEKGTENVTRYDTERLWTQSCTSLSWTPWGHFQKWLYFYVLRNVLWPETGSLVHIWVLSFCDQLKSNAVKKEYECLIRDKICRLNFKRDSSEDGKASTLSLTDNGSFRWFLSLNSHTGNWRRSVRV